MTRLPAPTVVDADGSTAEQAIAPAGRPITSRDFVSTFATNVTIQACTIAQGILLARALGVRGRGEFAAAILWPMFFAGICGFGTQVAVARRSAKSHDPAGLARTAAKLALLTGTIGSVLCWFLLPLLMPADAGGALTAARWFVPFVIFNHLALVLMAVDQGSGRFNRYNWTRLIVNPLFLTGVVLLWSLSVSVAFWYVIALLVANAGIAVIRLTLALRQPPTHAEHVGPARLVREALPFGVAGMLGPLFQQADKALLLFLLGTEKLGIYAVALTVSMAVATLPAAAGPLVFGIAAQDESAVGNARVARTFRMTAWLWIVAGTVLAVAVPWLLPIVYGRAFSEAILPAICLIPAAAFAGQGSILEESLRARGLAFVGVAGRIAGLAAMLTMALLLTPRWGTMGIVAAYDAAQVAVLVVMIWRFRGQVARTGPVQLLPRVADLLEIARRSVHLVPISPTRAKAS